MRHFFWVSLIGSLSACSGGLDLGSLWPSTTEQSASGSFAQGYTPPKPGAATDVVLQLSWESNPDPVAGYRVYFGTTAGGATTHLSDLTIASRALNSQAPSVTYNAGRDLGLDPGSQACFRLRAFNSEGVLSDWSHSACISL